MTERQKLVLDFIHTFVKMRGFSPSYSEIAQGLGMSSKSNIHRLVHVLQERGLLQIKPYTVRSLKVVDNSVSELVKL
jgi:repressor LexA